MTSHSWSGQAIITLRGRFNLTQEDLAHLLGITVCTVNRWENGHREPSKQARQSLDWLSAQTSLPDPRVRVDTIPPAEIRDLIKRLDLTQEEFAHVLGVITSTVNRWVNGHSKPNPLNCIVINQLANPPTEKISEGNGRVPGCLDAGPRIPPGGFGHGSGMSPEEEIAKFGRRLQFRDFH